MDIESVGKCIDNMDTAHYLEDQGYKNVWYDVEDDPIEGQEERRFTFEIPKVDGTLYISVESYYINMIPSSCYPYPYIGNFAIYDLSIYKNGKIIFQVQNHPEPIPEYFQLTADNYKAGDVISLNV